MSFAGRAAKRVLQVLFERDKCVNVGFKTVAAEVRTKVAMVFQGKKRWFVAILDVRQKWYWFVKYDTKIFNGYYWIEFYAVVFQIDWDK